MRANHAIGSLALAGLLALGTAARAASIQITFAGTVTDFDDDGLLDGSVAVGTPFSGSVSFDTSASDANPSSGVGTYGFSVPPYSFDFEVGSYSLESTAGIAVETVDLGLPFGDAVIFDPLVDSVSGAVSLPLDGIAFNFRYDDPSGGTLTSDVLGAVPFELASWPSVTIVFVIDGLFDPDTGDIDSASIFGPVTSLSVVPEASSSLLLATAGALASRWRRRGTRWASRRTSEPIV